MSNTALNVNIESKNKEASEELIHEVTTNLYEADCNSDYIIKDIITNDEELKDFLFTLGCFKGERVTLISILAENYVISVKDARYSIDSDLAKAIII